jgi:hypothetical protein
MERPRFKELPPVGHRLTANAARLRKEAQGTPPGVARDELIRLARQSETASHMHEWLTVTRPARSAVSIDASGDDLPAR